ncbi:MAG TPA: exonuclease SbcCD subunit D [Savagea sp.]
MKIVHTADWHLGKLVQGVYMTEDQRYALERFIEEMKEESPDAIIIAGDIYDRGIPPIEAVDLFDEVLTALAYDLRIPVLAIAGNHDSPTRLQFGRSFMRGGRYFVSGSLDDELEPVILEDEYGPVHFHLIPYVDPSIARLAYDDDTIKTHDDAMRAIIERLEPTLDKRARHVAVSHAFVTKTGEADDSMTSDSERPLSIGGAEYVSSERFKAFHYTALGHLHQAHHIGDETIRYSGSLLKYSLSEQHHQKSYLVVELEEEGNCTVEKRPFHIRRDVRSVEGYLADLLKEERSEDYVFVTLLDEETVLQPMEKIREVFPNAMHVERKLFYRPTEGAIEYVQAEKMTDTELFTAFFSNIADEQPTETMLALFERLNDRVLKEERER